MLYVMCKSTFTMLWPPNVHFFCAHFFRDCAKFALLNAKMHNLSPFSFFLVIFWGVLPYFVGTKLSDKNFGRAKKLTFRKSVNILSEICYFGPPPVLPVPVTVTP